MIAAVIFDLDGVLVDSEPVWERVRRGLVAERGGQWAPDAQRRLMGMSTPEWATYLSEDLGVGLPPDEVATVVVDRMAASYREHLPLLPGAVEAVRRLAARWPLGLASSAPAVLIETVLDSAGLRPCFQVTMSTEQVPRQARPGHLPGRGRQDRPHPVPTAPPSRTPPTACARPRPRACASSPSRTPGTRPTPTPSPGPAWSCPAWPNSPRTASQPWASFRLHDTTVAVTACAGTPAPARR